MCYIKNELLFNHLNLDRANISRLIYLSTYIDYNDRQENLLVKYGRDKKVEPINKVQLRNLLGLSESTFKRFLNDVKTNSLLYELDDKFFISNEYFSKGKCIFKEKDYTRIYVDTTRFLYENCTVSQHKQLSYAFQLIPKLHYETNVICENPDEENKDDLIKLGLKGICEFLEISTNKSSMCKFEKDLYKLKINVDGKKHYMFKRVIIKGRNGKNDYFVVNPEVIWKGNNLENTKKTIEFMVFK